ncbi:MAG: DUF4397 domain-containing protein [Actinomycetota bacterium]
MVNTQDEMADNSLSGPNWGGFEQLRLSDDTNAVNVTIGSSERWDKAHLRRLRQSADLPGLVPVIDSDFASDGKPFAVTPVVDSETLADRIPPSGSEWEDCAAITEAAARASHEAHLRGLFHGALSPDQVHVLDNDVAVSGIGLGLGGTPSEDYAHWVAPEVRDGGDPTERSDVYSLGKILEASLGNAIEDVPRSVRRLIMWSSSDTPEARPPSALEFASILAEAMGEDRATYSPAFIPTADTNDLASTAPEAVAAFTPGEGSGSSSLGTGAAIAGAGAAAIGAAAIASSLGDDDDAVDAVADAVVDDPDLEVDPDVLADAVDTGELPAEAVVDADPDVDAELEVDEPADIEAAAVATTELGTETADLSADLEDADTSVFDSQEYSDELAGTAADPDYDVPAAAQTVDLDQPFEPERRGNRAGILVGAIMAATLGVVLWGLLNSGDDSTDTADPAPTETTVPAEDEDDSGAAAGTDGGTATDEGNADDEVAGPGAEEEEPSTTTEAPTTTVAEDEAPEDEAPVEDEAPEEEVEPAPPAATVDGPITAEDAGIQVLHGIPGAEVDVYVNGQALAPGFTAGTIAGPANLDPGDYDIELFAASDTPPVSSADRSDDPVISQTVTVGADPATLVAHLDANGNPTLSAFAEDFEPLDPGTARVQLRHLAAAPGVQAIIDGEPADGLLEPGREAVLTLSAGEHTIETTTADGTPVKSATLTLADGEVAAVSVIGSAADDNIAVVVQRYTGLSTAPAAVPTGNSNLLADGEDPTALYILGIMTSLMAIAGGVLMLRRSRQVL